MQEIFYNVNHKKIYNPYLAQYESFLSNAPVKFSVNETVYDAMDWMQEPHQDLDQIMAQHAMSLRNRYDVLILHWSGGTDSHTVYNVFRKHNIHLDEIRVIVGNHLTPKFPEFFLSWMQQHHYDPTTEITKIDVSDANSKQSVIDHSDWIFNNICFMPVFAYSSFEPSDIERNMQKYGGKKWCMISGHEKPDLIYLKNKWYSRYEDKTMRQAMNPYVENFFLDPLISVKQSHMLKTAVKSLNVKVANGQRAADIYGVGSSQTSDANYQAHARACGRITELVPGHSNLQKKVTKSQLTDLMFDHRGRLQIRPTLADVMLQEKILDHHPLAVKYVHGIEALYHEHKFMAHMVDHGTLDAQNPLGMRSLFSKPYCIGS